MSENLHVIFGTGAVGCWTARALKARGLPVRAVNRSGIRPGLLPGDVELAACDLSDPAQAVAAAAGASVIYQALNPPYHRWHELFPALQSAALAAARATGARYVSVENLYMYDSSRPMTEDSPVAPRSRKGELRARMAAEVAEAQKRGDVRAAQLRSSDYFGPGVRGSALGERVFGNLVRGAKAQIGGSAIMPHSFAYIEDVGSAAAILGTREESLGKVWIAPHGPALTQGEMVARAARLMGGEARHSVASPMIMRLVGLFVPGARASVEMMYQFVEPFVVDARRFTQTFGLEATPVDEALKRTVEWYRT
jgi:nucleoside-diphosphate-sugar epimerase